MKNEAFDRGTVGLAAMLLLAGQLLYIVITQFHAEGLSEERCNWLR